MSVAQKFVAKTVYITGAGSGIGYQTALAFATQGARVVATDVNEAGLLRLSAKLNQPGIQPHLTQQLDITDEAATDTFVAGLLAADWLPDIVVNNAGVLFMGAFVDTPAQMWRKTLEVNVTGMAISTRAFVSAWLDQNRAGDVVNVGSMISIAPMPSLSAYVASKYAVEGLCEALALEFHNTDISFTCIHPGIINTPLVRNPSMVNLPDAQFEAIKQHYINDGLEPAEVTRQILKSVDSPRSNVLVGPGLSLLNAIKKMLPRKLYRAVLLRIAVRTGYKISA